MLVYGKNVLKELDLKKVRKAYLSKTQKDFKVSNFLTENHIRYELVDNNRLDKMVTGNHQGIIIDINDYDYYKLSDIANDENFVVMLDHLEDPHNLGAIVRTCECAGIKSIIIPKDRSVRVNDTVMKVSTGALERVKVILVSNLVDAINKLKKEGFFIYSADMNGISYTNIDYADKKVLVIGNEGNGISRLVKENSDEIISIPMKGELNSLNASVSAGILIYGMDKGE
ncbi:MAG: 23S rRNA (guanosine(2251)-2'-O)-methyltransferase RlmB [Bacilli bacterium]|nr:23S rRNA (guanosine(2251)-2'-O)-methyltransferase RlmB [Bacilli bacterium]